MRTFDRTQWPVLEETLVCRPVSFSAGPGLLGGQQRRHLENARWRGSLKVAPLERDAMVSFRAFLAALEGTRHTFLLPICAPENAGVSEIYTSTVAIQIPGSDTLKLSSRTKISWEDLRPGMRFSINNFMHEIKAMPDENYQMPIFPALRQDARAATVLAFRPPHTLVRLADDASGVAPVQFGRQTGPITLNFEEVWDR